MVWFDREATRTRAPPFATDGAPASVGQPLGQSGQPGWHAASATATSPRKLPVYMFPSTCIWPPTLTSPEASGSTTRRLPPLPSSYRRSKLELATSSCVPPYGWLVLGGTWRTASPTGK